VRIIGLDLSLCHTGYAFQTDGYRDIGVIEPKNRRGCERLVWIREQVRELAKGSDLVICEGYAFSRPNQAHQLGELHGVIRTFLYEHDMPLLLVAPAALKKFVTGKGKAEKGVVIKAVFQRFDVDVDDDNAADAAGLLFIGLALAGKFQPTTQEQRDVCNALWKANPELQDRLKEMRKAAGATA
jgi:Holliday junction resolvasome RuvABC endonuclease subunit